VFEIGSQQVQLRFPEPAVPLDPVARPLQRSSPQPCATYAPISLHGGELCLLQHTDMLRHGGQRHVEARCQLADGTVAGGELRQDRTPRGISQRGEGPVECVLIVNHMVYYCTSMPGLSRAVERAGGDGGTGGDGSHSAGPPVYGTTAIPPFMTNRTR